MKRAARISPAFLAALLAAASLGAGGSAQAGHSTTPGDDRRWLAQAGNGQGEDVPVIPGFSVQTVLFRPDRFPRAVGPPVREGFTRYLALGTIRVPPPPGQPIHPVLSQLAVSFSDDGLNWGPPEPATLRDADGAATPFLLNEPSGFFDVTYIDAGTTVDRNARQFRIHYRPIANDPSCPTDPFALCVASIHTAVSDDARSWSDDQSIRQRPAPNQVVAGAGGGFRTSTNGPTDVVFQPNAPGGRGVGCAAVDPVGPRGPSPWNCRWVMLYSGVDGNGRQYVALAWSAEVGVATDPTHVPGGVLFAGHTAPALSPGAAGSWDDDAATIGKIRLRPTSQAPFPLFDLYYAGGSQPRNACAGGAMGCWSLGSAVSSDGLTFDKTVENPVTPRELFDSFTQAPPVTLLHPVVVDDTSMSGDTHAKIYLTRVTNGGGTPDTTERDVFLAYTEPGPVAPAPSLEPPRIRIGAPRGFYGLTGVPLAIYLADPLGSDPSRNGVETWSLRVLVDGGPLNGPLLRGPRLVTALRTPAASVTGSLTGIPDGTHTLEVSIRDLDGNEASASTSFTVDTVAPATTVTQSPQGTRMGYPFGIIGVFYGRSVEPAAGAGVNRIEVLVTDPLGRRERFPVLERQITRVDATTWSWRWSAPFDSHFAVPGTYEISFLASDAAGNREGPSPDNTVEVFVV